MKESNKGNTDVKKGVRGAFNKVVTTLSGEEELAMLERENEELKKQRDKNKIMILSLTSELAHKKELIEFMENCMRHADLPTGETDQLDMEIERTM